MKFMIVFLALELIVFIWYSIYWCRRALKAERYHCDLYTKGYREGQINALEESLRRMVDEAHNQV